MNYDCFFSLQTSSTTNNWGPWNTTRAQRHKTIKNHQATRERTLGGGDNAGLGDERVGERQLAVVDVRNQLTDLP